MSDDNHEENFDSFRNKLLGLGRHSLRKSYYPELQKRIEELENIQEELSKYKDHLEELVVERTVELEKINKQLQQEIAERRQAEEGLRESEIKFKSFAQQALVGTYLLQDGILQYVNPKFANMFGYTVEECLNNMSFEILVYPEDLDNVKEQIRKRTLGEIESIHYTFRGVKKDGQIFHVEIYGSVSFHKGRIAAAGAVLDVTERREVEKALRESGAKYRRITENMNDIVTEVDAFGIIKYTSPSHEWNLGDNSENVIGRSSFDRVHPEDRERVAAIFGKAINTKTGSEAEYRYRHADGHYVWLRSSGRPMYDAAGEIEGQIISSTVITERKMAEFQKEAALESLKKEEEKYRTLISNIRDGVFIIQDDEIQFINEAFSRMTGYAIEEISKLELHEVIGPEAAKVVADNYRKTQSGENIVRDYEFCILRKDQTTIVHVNMMVEIIDYFGKAATLGMLQDITPRKQAEAEKQRLEERLNRAEKMEALGTLAGGVAHDLNNVLGIVVGYSEMLVDILDKDSVLRKYADNIMKSSVKGAAIIQDLLTLARRGVTVSEITDLNKLVLDYIKTPEFENLKSYHPNVKIRADLEDVLLTIKGSPIHLGKTIMNLVSNAFEAISGHGEVTIRTANRYLDHPIRGYDTMQEGEYAILIVSDTGSGISAGDLGKIFEPFYTKKVMGRSGTGLGLAVVWGTVMDHHGYIDVQSAEGKGSTFTLYFPVTRDAPEKTEKIILSFSYMGNGESILIVDDVKEQRELAMNMLGKLGYQVESVASGEEAIEYLKANKADLLILDMIMYPGIDGMETYRRILEFNPGQKAVIVSGFSETDRVRETRKMGARAFVRKPYILEKIGIAVRKELDRK